MSRRDDQSGVKLWRTAPCQGTTDARALARRQARVVPKDRAQARRSRSGPAWLGRAARRAAGALDGERARERGSMKILLIDLGLFRLAVSSNSGAYHWGATSISISQW